MTACRRPGWNARLAALVVVVALAATACGDGDPETEDGRTPESKVEAKQRAVTAAQGDFDEATAAFCADTEEYISAIDRYAGIFNESAVTVGDVKTAGADLAAPRASVESASGTVVAAREDLAVAVRELADAQAELEASETGGTTTTRDTSTTTTPLLEQSTVDRVKRAEEELEAAGEGISDSTPLTEATAAYNSAAFALQVAWMNLFVEADCLTDDQQEQAAIALRDYTAALQKQLSAAGFYDGEIDGVYGPQVVDAVSELQTQAGLPVTGYMDRATSAALDAALASGGTAIAAEALTTAAAVQTTLKLAGFWDGPVDGTWTPELTTALMELQEALGVEPTGMVDAETMAALQAAIEDASAAAAATTTTAASAESDETTTTAP